MAALGFICSIFLENPRLYPLKSPVHGDLADSEIIVLK
jgi:hypothetical protein